MNKVIWTYDQCGGDPIELESLIEAVKKHCNEKITVSYGEEIVVRVFGKTICSACGGSGYYDNTGSPKCGSCNGTGRG